MVHGIPLEETEIWQTQDSSTRPDIPEMLHRAGLRSALIRLDLIRSDIEILQRAMRRLSADADVLVCDAEIDHDLSAIAEASMALGRNTVWAGSAGLAYHLPCAAGFPYSSVPRYPRSPDHPLASGPTLFVVGSLSSVSRNQVKALAASSETVMCNIPPEVLLGEESSTAWREYELELERALDAGRDIAVFPDTDARYNRTLGQRLSTALARMVLPCADRVGALVATGGESARAVLEAWGIHRLRLVTEPETGLACSVTEGWSRQLPVLTKAGAFGTRQTLLYCQQFLHGLDRSSSATFFERRGQ
jgi:D-threonate/D-erythronate kinase